MSLYREAPAPREERPPALAFDDVFKIYRSGPTETVALRGVTLRVEQGEFVAVQGPSGGGKSTLLALAAALDEPSAGSVTSVGHVLNELDERERALFRAREVGIVFQRDNLLADLSALDNVALSVALAGRPSNGDARAALAQFGLEQRARNRAAELSGGEQQRVAIAAAGARRAPLLLADEPTGELDSENERVVLDALRTLCADHGSTVVVVTHSPRVAEAADRTIELRDGQVGR